jgi:hypothetical protein
MADEDCPWQAFAWYEDTKSFRSLSVNVSAPPFYPPFYPPHKWLPTHTGLYIYNTEVLTEENPLFLYLFFVLHLFVFDLVL